jgi:hypothetical protein
MMSDPSRKRQNVGDEGDEGRESDGTDANGQI